MSRFDKFYRSILLSQYFTKGWGEPEHLKKILEFRRIVANREKCYGLIDKSQPINITKEYVSSNIRFIEGNFHSPLDYHLPGLIPDESKTAYFQILLPAQYESSYRPICLHMAGTGDHFFFRRRHYIAKPLLNECGIGSIILENPFYGMRKPKYQTRSILHNVSDIFIMGGCLMLEALVLYNWCVQNGLKPIGATGLSMGGHMASLAATVWPEPMVLVPCLSWSTASGVFTEGVMSKSINWAMLQNQLMNNDILKNELRHSLKIIGNNELQSSDDFEINYRGDIEIYKQFAGKNIVGNSNILLEKTMKSLKFGKFNLIEQQLPIESMNFMKGLMDECTHLRNFSIPIDTSLIIVVSADYDGYIPKDSCEDIINIWPGCEVKRLKAGHVSAFVLYQKLFRSAIKEAFNRYQRKYL